MLKCLYCNHAPDRKCECVEYLFIIYLTAPGGSERGHQVDEHRSEKRPDPGGVYAPRLGEDRHGRQERATGRRHQRRRHLQHHTETTNPRLWKILPI
jgi:hypothetical protein